MAFNSKYGRGGRANFSTILVILSTCFVSFVSRNGKQLGVAAATQDPQIKKGILDKILTISNFEFNETTSHRIYQHVTCGATEVKSLGIYPAKGSEMGGTPVAVALQMDYKGDAGNEPDEILSFDSPTLNCKFGEATQPMLQGADLEVQLERIALTAISSTDTLFSNNFQLFVCIAPHFPVSSASPGPLPFSVSCESVEDETIEESTLKFEFTIASSVHHINPPFGRAGTEVTVKGSGFRNSSSLVCFFGQHSTVKADFLSGDRVRCTAPDQEAGDYLVAVSNNGIDLEGEWASDVFAYVPLPIVSSVQPQTMTLSTNATVSITGRYFAPHPGAMPVCSFGENLTSLAVFGGDDMLSCIIPTILDETGQNPSILNVRVSANGGIDFSTSSSRVFYYQPVMLYSVLPDATQAGSTITLHGENFHPSNLLSCWFQLDGDDEYVSVPATYISSTKIECPIPPLIKGIAQLWVSTDNRESGRSLNSLDFEVLDFLSLVSITPSAGSLLGGTQLGLQGTGFDEHSSTICRFGVATLSAKVLNSTFLSIVSPPAATALDGNSFEAWARTLEDSMASLEISTNGGHDYTDSGITFQYLDQLSVESMSPKIGPQWGGTSITFYGKGTGTATAAFGDLVCRFSLVGSNYKLPLSHITTIDENSVSCMSPSISTIITTLESSTIMSAHVEILARNGEETAIATGGVMFSFYPKATLTTLTPLGGSEVGGTKVEIQGSNFVQNRLKCLFNGIESPLVQWISSYRIVCESPSASSRLLHSSIINVTLATDEGALLTTDYLQFVYLPASHIVNFNPTFGSLEGGTPIHINGSNFDQIEGLPPQCLFSSSDEPTIATVLSRTLIKCTLPPAGLENSTTVGLSFNGGSDVAMADKMFIYISPARIDTISPNYISSNLGGEVTIRGKYSIPDDDLSEAWRCSFDDKVVAATTMTKETIVCFAPPMQPGLVEVGVSANGVDFSHALEVIYHLPTYIHEVTPPFAPETGGTVVVKGANFQPSPDLSCIFSVSPKNIRIAKAAFESKYQVTCSVPPNDIGTTTATLEISISKEKNSENPSTPFQYHSLLSISDEAEPFVFPSTDVIETRLNSDNWSMLHFGNDVTIEPSVVSEIGGSTISIVSQNSELSSCIFSATDTLSGLTSKSPASLATKYSNNKNGRKLNSQLLTCQAPKMVPGEYLLSLGSSDVQTEGMVVSDIAVVTVHPAFSLINFEPSSGPSSGETDMTIHGNNFPNATELSCKIGSSLAPARFVSQEKIICSTPPLNGMQAAFTLPTSFNVSVSANGQDFVEVEGMPFTYLNRPQISGVFPATGAATGGTSLIIHGDYLLPHDADVGIFVSFGNTVVKGVSLNETTATCVTPSLETECNASTVSIRISTNGGYDFSHRGIIFSCNKLSISHIDPSCGPEKGGNVVTIVGSGFTANQHAACRFGDMVIPARGSLSTMECVAPKSVAHLSVAVSITINGVDWASSPQTYDYLPMLQIYSISPSTLPTDVPFTVHIAGENFGYPSNLMCKIGSTISSKAIIIDDNTLECFIPPIHHPGKLIVDIVTEGGDSLLDRVLRSVKFYDPIDFRITPSFGSMNGGTVITAFLDSALSIGVGLSGKDAQLMCRFSLSNNMTFDVMASPFNGTLLSCVTPNMAIIGSTDGILHSTMSLISRELSLPVSLSFPFMFKTPPTIKTTSRSIGSSLGGTIVRVTGDGPGLWLNSTLLTCYFGGDTGEAKWISPLVVDCTSPSHNISQIALSVSDNGADLVESETTYSFHPDPIVASVVPHFGLSSKGNIVTLIGNGFSGRDAPMCLFLESHGRNSIRVDGRFVNETAIECRVPVLAPSEYICKASNNGGVEWGASGATFVSVRPPSIISLMPQYGIGGEKISVAVTGTNLAAEGPHNTNCVLFDNAGSRKGSFGAERVNATYVNCPVQCPSYNAKYFLGLSLYDHFHPSSMHTFWCDPKPIVMGLKPSIIGVAEHTPILIKISEIRSANYVGCIFSGNGQMIKVPGRYVSAGVECLSPEFDRPQSTTVSFSIDNHTLTDEFQIEVVDPITVHNITPRSIFGGSAIRIMGSNLIPEKMNCVIGDREGTIIMTEESDVLVCRSSANMEGNSAAEVILRFKEAPQLSTKAGAIEIHPTPSIGTITPLSGPMHGGMNIIIRGLNFFAIKTPLCYFGDVHEPAFVLTGMSMSCLTPKMSNPGQVQLRVSLDGGNSFHGEQPFSFFAPILLQEVTVAAVPLQHAVGNTPIAINGSKLFLRGEGFRFDLPIQCAIGGIRFVPATVLSSTEATCIFAQAMDDSLRSYPNTSETHHPLVEISIVTSDHIQASVSIGPGTSVMHHPLVEISYVLPLYGSVWGGESIELHVSTISRGAMERGIGPIYCRFGNKVALADLFNESAVFCTTPAAGTPGNTSLSLDYAGMPFSTNSLTFEYTLEPKVYGIRPHHGTHSGGTSVRITGLNLMPRGIVSCRFGHHESYGYLDTTENSVIYCITPHLNFPSSQTLFLKLDPTKDWFNTGLDYHFLDPITIKNVSPREIDHGVEFVRVKGEGFSAATDLMCYFGEEDMHTIAKAIVLSNTTIRCPLEVMNGLGRQVFLSITSNGIDFARSPSPLIIKGGGGIALRGLSPVLGPAFGGSKVNIYGAGFQSMSNLRCWFDSIAVRATIVSDENIECISNPIFIKDSQRIAVSNFTVTPHARGNSLNFTFYSHPPSLVMLPTHGTSAGGTNVRISELADILRRLNALEVQGKPSCKFNTIAVPATVEFGELVCVSPPLKAVSNSTVVPVALSLNGEDFVRTHHDFHYYHPPSVTSVTPEIIWIEAATEIVVRGLHFIPLNHASCFVGSMMIPAEVVSSLEIRCHVQLNQTYSNNIVPVGVSLNGQDVSNIIPILCQVNMPRITSASPLFVSDSGGTVVELKGHGFEQIKRDGLVKLTGSNTVAKLIVTDDKTASFDVPSSNGHDSSMIGISYGSNTFMDTGVELQYVPQLHITAIDPPFVLINRESRLKVSGKFDQQFTYNCALFEDDTSDPELEIMAEYSNGTLLICDVVIPTSLHTLTINYQSSLSLAVRRNEDNQASNAIEIFPTPQYAIDFVEPSIIPDAEAGAVDQLLRIVSPREFTFSRSIGDSFYCMFVDEIGTIASSKANIIAANEVRCVAPPLMGNAEVRLARDGAPQSNSLAIRVPPISQTIRLSPESGPVSGGTRIKVHGVGFAAFSEANIICKFGNESSTAEFVDDETIYCLSASNGITGDVTFVLMQAYSHGLAAISNSDTVFFYYSPPKLVECIPFNGPVSGGTEIKLLGEGLSDIGSSIRVSFSSIADLNRVAYSEEVKLSESSIVLSTPPSPTGSKGGMVTIQVSGNGQDYSSSGIYYNYTESIFIHSIHPQQVTENSCFNLTLLVENLFSAPSQCSVGGHMYSARQGMISGTVTCEICFDLHEGYHQVGLVTDSGVLAYGSSDLEVRNQINITKMTPSMGPMDGGTIVIVKGNDFESWGMVNLYCFFGDKPSLAKVINDTALQCETREAAFSTVSPLRTHVAPYHQLTKDLDSTVLYDYYEPEEINSFIPRSGPIEGGTTVKIFGSGFIDTKYLSCKFGNATTRAVFVSEDRIECVSPSLKGTVAPPKSIPLMISNNGVDHVFAGTYIYHVAPEVTRLYPSAGPALTKVTLTLQKKLEWVEKLACRIGDVLALANATSEHEMQCISPIQKDNETPNATVQMSLNGVDFFDVGLTFQYSNEPQIYSMSPGYGPMSGGNEVVVHGQSLDFSPGMGNVLCLFGSVKTMVTSLSATKMTCIAPPQNHGTVSFGIISKHPNMVLQKYHDNNLLTYIYLPPILMSTISPTFGSTIGGTLLSIHVENHPQLPDVENLYCVFGSKTTSIAQVESSDRAMVSCLTPPSDKSGVNSVVSVGLAQDQKPTLLTSADAQFQYTAKPEIKSIFPRQGPSNGGTIVTLQGNFEYTDKKSVHCKIGNQTSPALFLSNEEVKCITPGKKHIMREIQAIRITGSNTSPLEGSFTLLFRGAVSDPISASASDDEMREKLSSLPGMDDISVTTDSALVDAYLVQSFLVTFLGLVYEDQPLISVDDAGIIGDNTSIFVERIQPLCCDVSLSLNGVDYHSAENGEPLIFVYDEKFLVASITPSHGSLNGGTDVNLMVSGIEQHNSGPMCVFGGDEVEGQWVEEGLVSCSTPASLWEIEVTVGIRVGDVRSESMATYLFHPDPVITSVFPKSLPSFSSENQHSVLDSFQRDVATSSVDIYGNHFHNSSMNCVFDIRLPSEGLKSLSRRRSINRQTAIFYNSTFIRCPKPPSLGSFFSNTDSSWSTNETLIANAMLNISLEAGADWHLVGTIPYHAVVKTTSVFPRTGPRAGQTKVMVEGENFVNSTHLTCKFGSELGSSAQYISPTKVLCLSPHFPFGYGRVVVPVQVAVNKVDFSAATNSAIFEFHEPIVIKEAMPLIGLPNGRTIVNITLENPTMRLRAVSIQGGSSQVSISHMDPPYGPATGGNLVTIHGEGFTPTHYTVCKFGGLTTPAYFISKELIECLAPESDTNSAVDVTLRIGGVDVSSSQRYTYLPILIT